MDTIFVQSHQELQRELEDAKDALVIVNDNIKRVVGRIEPVKNCRFDKRCPQDAKFSKLPEAAVNKKSNDSRSIFNRLSPSIRYLHQTKPRLTSRVIRELPSRQEIVAAQCSDSESRARNRRMFGSLLGTLHKFCQEETRLKRKEEKKAQIERKLEKQELLERESLRKERESLFHYRKRKQLEIKALEQKIRRVKDFESWESAMHSLKPFIKTKTSPNIYFKPKVFSVKTEKLLNECQCAINNEINERRTILNQDLLALKDSFKMENLDKEENDDLEKMCLETKSDYDEDSILKEGVLESKENNSRNSSEPTLNSGVVAVKH